MAAVVCENDQIQSQLAIQNRCETEENHEEQEHSRQATPLSEKITDQIHQRELTRIIRGKQAFSKSTY